MEIWLPVVGYNNRYMVSDMGNVYSSYLKGNMKLFHDVFGYLRVSLSRDGVKKTEKVHQLVTRAFLGRKPTGQVNKFCVHHINGKKDDNKLSNLDYVSYSENIRHGYTIKGNHLNRITNSKLTEKQVLEIRDMYKKQWIKLWDVANIYGVSDTCILTIIKRRSWKNLQD